MKTGVTMAVEATYDEMTTFLKSPAMISHRARE